MTNYAEELNKRPTFAYWTGLLINILSHILQTNIVNMQPLLPPEKIPYF